MRPNPLLFAVWVLALCLAGGCATSGMGKSMAQSDRAPSKESAKKASKNTFRKPNSLAKSAKAKSDAAKSDNAKSLAGKSDDDSAADSKAKGEAVQASGTDGGTPGRSATTTALIQSELRDAPAAEREEMIKNLEGVPDDMVPKVLNARRMRVQIQQRQESFAKGLETNSGRSPIEQTAGNANNSGQDPSRLPPQSGLGSRTPWNQGRDGATAGNSNGFSPARDDAQPSRGPLGNGDPAQQFGAQQTAGYAPPNGNNSPQTSSGPGGQPVTLGFDTPREATGPATSLPPNLAAAQYPQAFGTQGGIQGGRPQFPLTPATAGAGTFPLGQLTPGQYSQPGDPNARQVVGANGSVPFSGSNADINQAGFTQPPASPEQLQKLISFSESEVAQLTPGKTDVEKQRYIEKHVYLRMLYMMSGQQERAMRYIPGLEPADQEFWQQMFWGMALYFDGNEIPNSADRAAQSIQQINLALLKLKEKANLELRKVTFCHKISSFGDYERFPREEFAPGQPVLIYAELGNFHSELAADGRYRTMLRSTLEVHRPGPQGELIEKIPYQATEDLCRNHRHDYYHSYSLNIPQKISPGPYVLKLAVEDQLSQKVATESLNFTVK